MARSGFTLACCVTALAFVLFGCKTSEPVAAPPEPAEPEPAKSEPTATVAAGVTEMTDDQLCAWMCANCYGEYAGLLEYPGDCRGKCKSQITTGRCSDEMRAKVRCQVQDESCDACETEKQAALQCLRDCAKIERLEGKDALPDHCKQ